MNAIDRAIWTLGMTFTGGCFLIYLVGEVISALK